MIHPMPAFWRALHSLAHPLSLVAVILLLVNDHYLRFYHPSWLTGKLGDFAWLVFAPFIAALFFSWIVPSGVGHAVACPYQCANRVGTHHRCVRRRTTMTHEVLVAFLSFTTIGLWFSLAKTVPAVHALTTTAWEAIIGWQGTLRLDPTDLLTLPALLIGWWVWRRSPNTPINLRPLAYVALGLGIVATLASDSSLYADYGITTLCYRGDEIVARADPGYKEGFPELTKDGFVTREVPYHYAYVTQDGGFSWQERHIIYDGDSSVKCPAGIQQIADPRNELIQYRWTPDERIERSTDGGVNWSVEVDLAELRQEVRILQEWPSLSFYYSYRYKASPVTGLIDPLTGNLILAMSYNGVLVRTPDSVWHWITVDYYNLDELQQFDGVFSLLDFIFLEALLSLVLAFVIVETYAVYLHLTDVFLRLLILVTSWIVWIYLLLLVKSTRDSDDGLGAFITYGFIQGVIVVLGFTAAWYMVRYFNRKSLRVLLVGLTCGLLYLLPFIFWSQGTIPRYTTALAFALLLAACGLVAGALHLRKVLPVLPKPEPVEQTEVKTDG